MQIFSFEGRATRGTFWLVFILSIFVSFAVVLFTLLALPALLFIGIFSPQLASIVSILLYVLIIPMWWISIATTVKRFHDRNKSGWWYLIALVPIIGFLWIIIECGFLAGTPGTNLYGDNGLSATPLASSAPLAPTAPSAPIVPTVETTPSSIPLA